ncbi:DUF493 domain-containing protein [Candidatus Halobeggiatoa sp. HSG11]|nr:DUF493 domain-containing protein [Candidatus Halobeggiatoa sp. HSG11]
MSDSEELLKFPCEFPIKVMGTASQDFEAMVVETVHRHIGAFNTVKSRYSNGGKYMSVTVTFIAKSRPQLDALYMELTKHELVKMVL